MSLNGGSDLSESHRFDLVQEIAQALSPESWILVGGMMVHAHSAMAGVALVRPTLDADIVVELEAKSYASAAHKLTELGFALHDPVVPNAPAYRYDRGRDRVDLMVPDRGAEDVRHRGRNIMRVPGSSSALRNWEAFELPDGTEIRVPDLTAALSLKGAATETSSDKLIRHAQDGVVLLACAAVREPRSPSKSERRNLNKLVKRLMDPEAWSLAAPGIRRLAVTALRRHFRPDWTAPDFVLPRRWGS